MDNCGVCNGNSSTCCTMDCSSLDENMVCDAPYCVCRDGYVLINDKCEIPVSSNSIPIESDKF